MNRKVHQILARFECEFHVLKHSWDQTNKVRIENSISSKTQKDLIASIVRYTPDRILEFMAAVDICIIAIPQTSETEGIIGSEELASLGKDGILVNVGRGSVVDEKALFESLQSKNITGAALDVWYNYHPDADDQGRIYPYNYPFHRLENVILSPHRAASPFDDLARWDEVIENLKRISAGRTDFLNCVDLQWEY